MLSKRHKLSRAMFPDRKEQKLSWNGRVLRIYVYTSGGVSTPRFAVVVPKNLSKGAVTRNLFKRRVAATIRANMKAINELSHKKYVVFPKEPLRSITLSSIKEDIQVFVESKKKS